MQKTQKDLSIIELKAIAFDEVNKISTAQNILNIINDELKSREENAQTKTKMENEEVIVTPEVTEEVVETVEEVATVEEVVA